MYRFFYFANSTMFSNVLSGSSSKAFAILPGRITWNWLSNSAITLIPYLETTCRSLETMYLFFRVNSDIGFVHNTPDMLHTLLILVRSTLLVAILFRTETHFFKKLETFLFLVVCYSTGQLWDWKANAVQSYFYTEQPPL